MAARCIAPPRLAPASRAAKIDSALGPRPKLCHVCQAAKALVQRKRPARRAPRASSAAVAPAESESEAAADEAYETCDVALASASNDEHSEFTVLKLTVKDYPGLVRVASWALNGMGLLVERAFLSTGFDDDLGVNLAQHEYYLTCSQGSKVRDLKLLELVVQDHCTRCAPSVSALNNQTFWEQGDISIDNEAHPECSVVYLRHADRRGMLLEAAATLTALGCDMRSAEVATTTGSEAGPACDITDLACRGERAEERGGGSRHAQPAATQKTRTLVFRVTGPSGGKLTYQQSTGLLYTFGLLYNSLPFAQSPA